MTINEHNEDNPKDKKDERKSEDLGRAKTFPMRVKAFVKEHGYWFEVLAIGIELLVVFLIWLELRGSDEQLRVLQKLNSSADETAKTLTAVRKAQEGSLNILNSTLQPQVDVLNKTEATLESQLAVSKRQQKLISSQLAIQQSIIAEQQRKPVPELRAFTYTQTGSAFETLSTQNGLSLISYAASLISSDNTRSVSLGFVFRNVGTAPVINFSPQIRVPETIKIKCVDYPQIRLFGDRRKNAARP